MWANEHRIETTASREAIWRLWSDRAKRKRQPLGGQACRLPEFFPVGVKLDASDLTVAKFPDRA